MEDKVFLNLGDIVLVRLDIPNKPIMYIIKKINSFFKNDENKSILIGMKCRWFTNTGELQEGIFNTKDLIKID